MNQTGYGLLTLFGFWFMVLPTKMTLFSKSMRKGYKHMREEKLRY